MELKAILADKATYPDNLAMNISGTQVTLGDLRGLSAADQKRLNDAEKAAEVAKGKFETDNKQLLTAQSNTAQLYAAVQKGINAVKTGDFSEVESDPIAKSLFEGALPANGNGRQQNDDPFAALSRLENDQMLAPLAKISRTLRAELTASQSKVGELLNTQKQMAERYINDRLTDIYERVVPDEKQADQPLEKVIRHAIQSGMLTSTQVPDIKRAYKDLTAADTAKDNEAAIRADERKKAQEEFNGKQIAVLPGGAGNSRLGLEPHAQPKAGAYKSLDEALAAAANDKDIWNMSGGVQ